MEISEPAPEFCLTPSTGADGLALCSFRLTTHPHMRHCPSSKDPLVRAPNGLGHEEAPSALAFLSAVVAAQMEVAAESSLT